MFQVLRQYQDAPGIIGIIRTTTIIIVLRIMLWSLVVPIDEGKV